MNRLSMLLAHIRRVNRFSAISAAICLALLSAGVVFAQIQLPGNQLTSETGNDLRPSWSPDGGQIAYFNDREGSFDIWVMDSDGSNKRQLTEGPSDDRRPSWSPDGTWLTFDSDRAGNRDIWIIPAQGGEPIQVTQAPSNDNFPSWSPDGTRIAYFAYQSGQLDIWVVDVTDLLAGGSPAEPVQITADVADERQSQCTFACHTPSWSPDSRQIAYTGSNHTEIWIVGADGSDPHELHFEEAHMHFPNWTSDGRLLLLSEHSTVNNDPVNDVWIADPDGSNASIVFHDIPHGGPFYWNPSAPNTIAFHSPRTGNFDIFWTNLSDTGNYETMPQEALIEPTASGSESQPSPTPAPQAEPTSAAIPPAADQPNPVAEGGLSPLRIAILGGAAIFFLLGLSTIFLMLRRSK